MTKSGEYHSFAMLLIEVLEDPNIQAVIQYANATHKSWLTQGKDYALNQLKSLPPIHMLLTGIDRYNHFRDQGMNPLFALVSANAWNIFEMTGAKGVYEGFTEEDAWTGEKLDEEEAHWRGFIGGMTIVLTASGVAEVFIPARGATVVLGLGTRVEASAASKLPAPMQVKTVGQLALPAPQGPAGYLPAPKVPAALRQLQSKLDELAERELLPKFREIDPNLKAGYTGSFKTGVVGNPGKPTFGQPINMASYDIDFWIESDVLYKKYGPRLVPDSAFRDLLSKTPGFEGMRPGKKGFTIKFKPSTPEACK